jgi:hypothetical protein
MSHEPFFQFEEQKLVELDEEIISLNNKNKKDKLILPDGITVDKRRFLQATGYNNSKTIQILKEYLVWRKDLLPPKLNLKAVELLNCGFMYIHGRDNNYRPIMILNADVYMKLKDKYLYADWLTCVIYFMEYTIKNLLIPGQVENWNVITDVNGVNLIFLPGDLKKFMSVMQSNYRCRLYVNYIIGMGSIMRGLWKMIKGMLDETTQRKIQILESNTMHKIMDFIHPDQVEKNFGGNAETIIPGGHNCFPPIMPSGNYLQNIKDKEAHLISEESYKEMHMKKELTVTGEFYLDKWRLEDEEKEIRLYEERRLKMEHDEKKRLESEGKVKGANEIILFEETEGDLLNVNDINSGISNKLDNASLTLHNVRGGKNNQMIQEDLNEKSNGKIDQNSKNNLDIENEFPLNHKGKIKEMKAKFTSGGVHHVKKDLFHSKNKIGTTPEIFLDGKSKFYQKNLKYNFLFNFLRNCIYF